MAKKYKVLKRIRVRSSDWEVKPGKTISADDLPDDINLKFLMDDKALVPIKSRKREV